MGNLDPEVLLLFDIIANVYEESNHFGRGHESPPDLKLSNLNLFKRQ